MTHDPLRSTQGTPLTHAALVWREGDIDVTLAPSAAAALTYLRQRAQDWEEADYPLLADLGDPATATVEQLSWVYADGDPDEHTGIAIGVITGIYDPPAEEAGGREE
jgi:hypothetical protein